MYFKKGMQLGEVPAAVLILIFVGLFAVIGNKIFERTQVGEWTGNTTVNFTSAAYNAAGNSSLGITQIVSQLSLVGLIVVMAVVIGVLWSSFRFGGSSGM
jgi:hypothetical protein